MIIQVERLYEADFRVWTFSYLKVNMDIHGFKEMHLPGFFESEFTFSARAMDGSFRTGL